MDGGAGSGVAGAPAVTGRAGGSDGEEFLLLGRHMGGDLGDGFVGGVLNFLFDALVLVLGQLGPLEDLECIAAGVACLWGPAHGGANEATLMMLREIGTVDRIPEFIAKAKDKDDPFRLMGFGHRVYKNFDPRAKVMKESADEVLDLLGIENNPTLQVAKELERIALEDPYFKEKKLYPNVDFYSGIILDAMGFPTSMFTPIFALARTVGWISQWKEMLEDPQLKIGRPRQLYIGAKHRDYVDVEKR